MHRASTNSTKHVVIVGCGFTGTATAINLLRLSAQPFTLSIIDPRGTFGPGLAYSVPSDRFKLNVKAKAMGAFPDKPEHFLAWLRERDDSVNGEDFLSRRLYGEYLQELFTTTVQEHPEHTTKLISDECHAIETDPTGRGYLVRCASGAALVADVCIVAIGNLERSVLDDVNVQNACRQPYVSRSYDDLASLHSIAIVGSGLTAIDTILEAEGRGFTGTYTVISRHGRFPLPHEDLPVEPVALPTRWFELTSVRELLRIFRPLAIQHRSTQPVIEAMRPHLQAFWQGLPLRERRRFLRHLRARWDVNRHRTPREHHAVLDKLQQSGRLSLIAGRMKSALREHDGSVRVTYSSKGQASTIAVDTVMMCAGPESDLTRSAHPLAASILAKDGISRGPLGLGISQEHGRQDKTFFVLGPLQREDLWEITAVRELRSEAARVAQHVCTFLQSP